MRGEFISGRRISTGVTNQEPQDITGESLRRGTKATRRRWTASWRCCIRSFAGLPVSTWNGAAPERAWNPPPWLMRRICACPHRSAQKQRGGTAVLRRHEDRGNGRGAGYLAGHGEARLEDGQGMAGRAAYGEAGGVKPARNLVRYSRFDCRSASRNAPKSLASCRSMRSSGCHRTASTQRFPGNSNASTTQSGDSATTASPGATRSTHW
jgi:hypothetical protein